MKDTIGKKPVLSIPTRTIINMKSGFVHKLLCDGPTFSTGAACVFDCSFCYVPDAMRKLLKPLLDNVQKAHHEVVIRRENAVEVLQAQLLTIPAKRRAEALTIYASPLVDVAATIELCRETVECCKLILSLTNWDIRLLSKSALLPWIADKLDEWQESPLGEFHQAHERMIFGVSTGTPDDALAKTFEQGTALVSKRIASIRLLQDRGWRTFGMLCPMLPMGRVELEEAIHDLTRDLRADRMEHVWCEVMNTRGESMRQTVEALSAGGYHHHALRVGEVANDKLKWEENARLTFSVAACYIEPGKLRFLQYVTEPNRDWWTKNRHIGAVLL